MSEIIGFTLPYAYLQLTRGLLLAVTVVILVSLYNHEKHNEGSHWEGWQRWANYFKVFLWIALGAHMLGVASDLVSPPRTQGVGLNSFILSAAIIGKMVWGYRLLLWVEAMRAGAEKFGTAKAIKAMKAIESGIPLNHVKMTSESK
jgi:hypothetical protein